MSQPRFQFPGIRDYISVNYTLSHGISPGRIQVVALAETINPDRYGTAEFSDPTTGVVIRMPDCIVDKPYFETLGDGRTIARIDILDQRWRWQRFGQVSGQWNVRNKDGSAIEKGTEKTPRELMKICFDAMGVDRPNLSQVPNEARPYVEWDITNPAQALAAVADTVGCVVVLKPGGRVFVEQVGQGKRIPKNNFLMAGQVSYDPPELSLGMEFFAGPTMYQIDAELEAVGEDVDGKIKPLDDLSYKPKKGWAYVAVPNGDFLEVDKKHRELAKKSLYRMYRVKPSGYMPGVEKKKENKIASLDEMLPLLRTQVETEEFLDGTKQRRPPWVYGEFLDESDMTLSPPPIVKKNADLNKEPQNRYYRGFSVDSERGVVQFSEPVYQFVYPDQSKAPVGDASKTKPAKLFLRIATNWRKPKQRDLQHWSYLIGRKSDKFQPLIIYRRDVALEVYPNHAKKKTINNEKEVIKQAKFYLQQAIQSLQTKEIGGGSYVGLQPIEPDGAIRQVSWSINTQGTTASKTDVSVNFDDPALDMSYEDKRLFEKIQFGLRNQALETQAKGSQP